MTEPVKSTALTVLLKQAQTIVTFVYLSMVGVGMLYYHQKYSAFDINIFQYADIFYFLVAPFEDFFIFLLCSLAVAVFFLFYATDGLFERKLPRLYTMFSLGMNKASWSKQAKAILWPVSFIAVLVLYSDIYGDRAKKAVLESEPITIAFSDNQRMSGQMIGKTDSTLFLLMGKTVKAIPLNSEVKEIVITTTFLAETEEESSRAADEK